MSLYWELRGYDDVKLADYKNFALLLIFSLLVILTNLVVLSIGWRYEKILTFLKYHDNWLVIKNLDQYRPFIRTDQYYNIYTNILIIRREINGHK
jgi:hypothetical protein